MPDTNLAYRLAARPVGLPRDSDWELTEEPVPQPGSGQFTVAVQYVSLDPAMRGWMDDRPSYVPPVRLGEVMRAGAVGRVIASQHPDHPEGSHVSGVFGVQQYALSDGSGVVSVDPALAPLPRYLGVLGMPGMTAYFGLLEVGGPQPGQTVLVSGAAGAVGATVGQIARIRGCRTVGVAGGPQKCRLLVQDYGFDAAIDYKTQDVSSAVGEYAPDGVDVYFDNVGGDILDAALAHLARHARVVICGAISQYNATGPVKGPANYLSLLVNRASMTGMLVSDYTAEYPRAMREMAGWLADGRLTAREDVATGGVEAFPETFLRLFSGAHTGKLVLEIARG